MSALTRRTALALGAASATLRTARAETVDVNFITDFGYYGRHAYFFVALDKGYYKAEGLNIQILRGQGSADAIRKVGAGAATIGFADAGSLVLARGNDGVPVKLVSIAYALPPQAIFALEGSGIKTPKDLEGRTVADTAASSNRLMFGTYAAAAGIDASKVKWENADGGALPSLLATGRVDAIGQFVVGQPMLEAATGPKKLVRLAYKDAGLTYYGSGLIAAEDTIAQRPEVVKGFVRATIKGMQDAFAAPAEAAEILHKYHREIDVKAAQEEVTLVRELAVVPGGKLGLIDPARVKSTIEVMSHTFTMQHPVTPEELCAPDFVA
jgi:NitT/TauT family transport system substrate-binding protein